ncbi:MAG: hypothetical protein ACQEXX_01195 [Bacillota bacterium]
MVNIKLLCIKNVILNDGTLAFTEGKEYKGYKSSLLDMWSYKRVIRAKNDQGDKHIIKEIDSDRLNVFYNTHFIEIG